MTNNKTKNKSKLIYPIALTVILIGVLLYIEYMRPYFFLQDDNRGYYLPYLVNNYRSLMRGEFAFYNFYQSMGMPSFSTGQSMVFYPIAYLSVFLSKALLGHTHAAMDILVIIHLIIGALGAYYLVKHYADEKAGFFAGLTWVLSSYVMYASNSWIIISTVAAYLPWIIHYTLKSVHNPIAKNRILAIVFRVILFYAGHIQFFVYAVLFEFLTAVIYILSANEKQEKIKKLLAFIYRYAVEYIAVFFLSAPLLLPMYHHMTISFGRSGKLGFMAFADQGFPIGEMLLGKLYPILQSDSSYFAPWRNTINLGHLGYCAVAVLLAGLVFAFVKKKDKTSTIKYRVFLIPAIVAMLWASSMIFQSFIYLIPILNRFRWPFKLGVYMDFFLVITAGLILADILKRIRKKKIANALFAGIIVLQLVNFILLYTVIDYKDFGEHHADDVPLEDEIVELIDEGRLLTVDFDTWEATVYTDHDYYTVPSMLFNYGLLFETDCFMGYEQNMPLDNHEATLHIHHPQYYHSEDGIIPVDYLRSAGVKYYLLPKEDENNVGKLLLSEGMEAIFADDIRTLYYDSAAMDLTYLLGEGSITKTNRTNNTVSADVKLQADDTIVFNYLYNDFFTTLVDGEKADIIKHDDLLMAVELPAGEHSVVIRYVNPYFRWGLGLFGLFVLVCCGGIFLRKKGKANL